MLVGIESPLIHVSDDADDLGQTGLAVYVNAFPDGVLVRKIFLGEDFIDDHDQR